MMNTVFKYSVVLLLWGLFTIAPKQGLAQSDTIWYGADWEEVGDNVQAFYYRIQPKKGGDGYYKIIDYYITGEKQMEASSTDAEGKKLVGKVIWYYPNGKPSKTDVLSKEGFSIKSEEYHPNGQLKFSIQANKEGYNGSYVSYHANGKKAETGTYKAGEKTGTWQFYDTLGNNIGTIVY